MRAQGEAKGFDYKVSSSTLSLEIFFNWCAVLRMEHGGVAVADHVVSWEGTRFQIKLSNSLLTGPSCMELSICGLSSTPKRDLWGGEGSFRAVAQA